MKNQEIITFPEYMFSLQAFVRDILLCFICLSIWPFFGLNCAVWFSHRDMFYQITDIRLYMLHRYFLLWIIVDILDWYKSQVSPSYINNIP